MKKIATVLGTLFAATVFAGCIQYQLVERNESGSTYRLLTPDHSIPPELQKEVQMSCGGGAKIVKEGEVPIGEVSHTNASASESFGVAYGSSTTDTTTKTEWRVTFQCNGSAPPADAQPATAEPAGGNATVEIKTQ
ncbi:MAG: hypothetical protein U0414_13425 [Polyangiaceae bacterium]